MSYMKKLIPILIAFVIIGLLIAKLYDTGINRPSLVYKHIPQETVNWVNSLHGGSQGGSMGINAQPTGPFKWKNTDDYLGKPSAKGRKWGKYETDSIVLYFRQDKDAVWKTNAMSAGRCAEEAVPELKRLFGKYYGPASMNGRKLPIYLADSTSSYHKIIRKLSADHASISDYDNTDALMLMEVGPLGLQVRGIVLHPDCFRRGTTKYKQMIRKEMARYCFYASLDYSLQIHHFQWFTEGLAEYFSQYCPMLEKVDSDMALFISDKCVLTHEFPELEDHGLRAADSFFRFYADKHGDAALTELVQSAYVTCSDSLFLKNGLDAETLKQEWLMAVTN